MTLKLLVALLGILMLTTGVWAERTTVSAIAASTTGYPTDGTSLVSVNGDVANGLRFAITGRKKQLLQVYNYSGGTVNVSVSSVADPLTGRTGDIETDAILTEDTHIYGPFEVTGWETGGYVNFSVDTAGVSVSVITLP